MNLINDAWIPAIRQDGTECKIAPWQIAETENPVVELCAPRADFQGALYQFLIGLLQTCVAPEDIVEWEERYIDPISPGVLQDAFDGRAKALDLVAAAGSPAFLQDLTLEDGEEKDIAGLLIDAPGGKPLKTISIFSSKVACSMDCALPVLLRLYLPCKPMRHRAEWGTASACAAAVRLPRSCGLWARAAFGKSFG